MLRPDPSPPVNPVSYLEMLLLEKQAKVILTDSGGVQKEAYFFKVPCVTLREETEWGETVEAGWNVLAGANERSIVQTFNDANKGFSESSCCVFGNGKSAEAILQILSANYLAKR